MDWSEVGDLPAPEGVDEQSWWAAVDRARDYCGWHLAPEATQTLVLDGSGGTFLPLPSLQVRLIAAVIENGRTLAASDYVLSRQSWGLHRNGGRWSDRPASIEVQMTHGYSNMPRAVAEVARSLVVGSAAYGSAQAGSFSLRSPESAQGGAVGLNEYQAHALSPHRLPPLP